MPCRLQGTFDLRMEEPPTRQLTFDLRPRGSSFWQKVKAADGELVRDAFYDMMQRGDVGDDCDIVVPIVAGPASRRGYCDIEAGAGMYAVPDLTHTALEEIWPVCSNGVLQRFIKDIVTDTKKAAMSKGFDPQRLPQTPGQAKRMKIPEEYILPVWMNDKVIVASVEKWIRENAVEHVPELRDLHEGEEESGRLATQLFLETGWNPICDDSGRPPRAVREHTVFADLYRDWDKAATKAGSADMRKLAGVGLVSEWLLNNGSEETCALTAPWLSPLGFDSARGLSGEELDDVHTIIGRKRRGEPFEGVLDESNCDYRYRPGGARIAKHVVAVAEEVWAKMVQRNGSHQGEDREVIPNKTLMGHYLEQPKRALVTPPGGVYKTLGSGLVVPV